MDSKILILIVMTIGLGRSHVLKKEEDEFISSQTDTVMEMYRNFLGSENLLHSQNIELLEKNIKKNLREEEEQVQRSRRSESTEEIPFLAPEDKIPIEDIAATVHKLALNYATDAIDATEDKTEPKEHPNIQVPNWSWLTHNAKYDRSLKLNLLDSVSFLTNFVNCLKCALPRTVEEKLRDKLENCDCQDRETVKKAEASFEELEKKVERADASLDELEKEIEKEIEKDVEKEFYTKRKYGEAPDLDIVEDSKDDVHTFISDEVDEDLKDVELLAEENAETPVGSFDYVDSM